MKSNIRIEYNEQIIQTMRNYGVSTDILGSTLLILFALYENRQDILDHLDDSNRDRRLIILYRQLVRKNFLETTEEDELYHYNISMKGKHVVEFVKEQFSLEGIDMNVEIIENNIVVKEFVGDWIQQYLETFPKEKRDNSKVVTVRMEEFMENFSYDKDTIIGGAKMYNVYHEQKDTEMQYRKKSQYFIYFGNGKSRTWDLATWCENYLTQDKKEIYNTTNLDIL